jgi:hypothetical protein
MSIRVYPYRVRPREIKPDSDERNFLRDQRRNYTTIDGAVWCVCRAFRMFRAAFSRVYRSFSGFVVCGISIAKKFPAGGAPNVGSWRLSHVKGGSPSVLKLTDVELAALNPLIRRIGLSAVAILASAGFAVVGVMVHTVTGSLALAGAVVAAEVVGAVITVVTICIWSALEDSSNRAARDLTPRQPSKKSHPPFVQEARTATRAA